MTNSAHHYAFDAVPLLGDCMDKLQKTIDHDLRGRHDALYDMKEVLVSTEHLLHRYLAQVLEKEQKGTTGAVSHNESSCLTGTMAALKRVLEAKQRQEELQNRKIKFWNPQDPLPTQQKKQHTSFYTARSATDTLLFRLIVALQLCLVRIDDAHFVLTGRRIGVTTDEHKAGTRRLLLLAGSCCVMGAALSLSRREQTLRASLPNKVVDGQLVLTALAKVGTACITGQWVRRQWHIIWMTDKIVKSSNEIEEWIQQWRTVQTTSTPSSSEERQTERSSSQPTVALLDDKSRRLIDYAMKHSPKSYFWQSQGEIRFLMLKRFMDVYYASVGTAIDSTNSKTSTWRLPLVAGAAASFYSITGTGASQKASQAVNTASRDLIQHAWGMVSFPSIKTLMLQASRLFKGASVADRLEISGVPCFVLSREPAPELAAALKRQRKTHLVSRMSTIAEFEEGCEEQDEPLPSRKRFAGSCGRYRQRDVILHLTGGGFFAHTIASDLPYLLDWSASTGAVVICPEYALLPEHTFPVALEEIIDVYEALVNGVDLGFEVNRIVVTGESAGGNLATSLCVQLGLQQLEAEEVMNQSLESGDDATSTETIGEDPTRMPDALMLSCAALDLSLELSHSRVVGTEDPVLPSGLISAISDAYLPPAFSKQDPLASPIFSPDAALRLFPSVLLFAGSNDPLLDDSVAFNERLRCCGVQSELRVAHNMPHAYWGLGTAGFPEAQQVQQECQEWLVRQFR